MQIAPISLIQQEYVKFSKDHVPGRNLTSENALHAFQAKKVVRNPTNLNVRRITVVAETKSRLITKQRHQNVSFTVMKIQIAFGFPFTKSWKFVSWWPIVPLWRHFLQVLAQVVNMDVIMQNRNVGFLYFVMATLKRRVLLVRKIHVY